MKRIHPKLVIFSLLLLLFSCLLDDTLQKNQVIYAINASMLAKATQCKETLHFVTLAAADNVTAAQLQNCQSFISVLTCPMDQKLPGTCAFIAWGLSSNQE